MQAGLWLLNQAMGSLRASAGNAALRGHTDSALRNMLSIGQVLRSLGIQVSCGSKVKGHRVEGHSAAQSFSTRTPSCIRGLSTVCVQQDRFSTFVVSGH